MKMKKLPLVVLCFSLFVPLYAQDEGQGAKEPFSFARRYFEIGIDAGAGFANDILGVKDVLKRNVVIDFDKIEESLGDKGANIKAGVLGNFFMNIRNIRIGSGRWDFGVFAGADGSISANIPKSIFTFISEGNRDQKIFTGDINGFGGVFAEAGIKTSAKYGKLRLSFIPAVHSPMIYVPKSEIKYVLDTEDGVSLATEGAISIYSPFLENGELNFGFDITLQGEYALLPFLDLGGVISRIPISPAKLQNRMRLDIALSDDFIITGDDLLGGEGLDFPEFDFTKEYDIHKIKVWRPMRFDVYARFKPIAGKELLVLKPSLGFTVCIGESETYFNFGAEARLNLIDLFIPYVSFNREEGVWNNRFGFAFCLRAFELDLEAALQSQSFKGSFEMKGLSLNVGLRFGW